MTTADVIQFPDRGSLPVLVAGNVRAEAARKGWNQSDLARALGVHPGTVQRKWTGSRHWQLAELEDVAKVLDVAVQDLLVRDQLAMLADRSRKVLAAGISGDQVRKAAQEWFAEGGAAVPLRVSTSRRGSA